MARNKIDTDIKEASKPKNVSSFFNALRKNTGSTSFKNSKYAKPDHYIDTGSYGLNRICSGSVFGGVPSGIIVNFNGEEAAGKTLIACNLAKNAQKKNGYGAILYFDSEGGAPLDMLENAGVDTDKVEHILVDSVEDCTVKLLAAYNRILEFQETNPDFKCLLILDSVGALVRKKVLIDADKGDQKSEMGGRAKLLNDMVKACTIPALKTQSSLILLNHIYDDPNSMYASKLKNVGGGRGMKYMARLSVQFSKLPQKGDQEAGYYDGTLLRFFTTKASHGVRPFLETEVPLSFETGFRGTEFWGLIDDAIKLGFIKNPKQGWYQVPSYSDKLLRHSELEGSKNAKDIWKTFIKEYDEASQKKICYGKMEDDDADSAMNEDTQKEAELNDIDNDQNDESLKIIDTIPQE